jgi:anthranilate synthase component I
VHSITLRPSLEEFQTLSKKGNVIPVYTKFTADFETPLSAYTKIREQGCSAFLLESAESTEKAGRWSIVGSNPKRIFEAREKTITIRDGNNNIIETKEVEDDVLAELERQMSSYKPVIHGEIPPFFGGIVGYLGYDCVRQFEPSIGKAPTDDLGVPDAIFMLTETLIVFDLKLKNFLIIANAFIDEFSSQQEAYAESEKKIGEIINLLRIPINIPALNIPKTIDAYFFKPNIEPERFEANILKGKEYIAAGDVFQFVPSQRFEINFTESPVNLYRALRHVNPSPYMFLLELDGFSLVGSSPEVHVRAIKGRIDIRPIAGTRWRGETPEEDDALAADLMNDQKECSEHLMLVDLARNDVGRIAEHGSVKLDDFMIIERYSHVMHIVSNVTGTLDTKHSAYDVLRATFPAGTVSGAPKIRAMQIIDELETTKRCTYAGAVGYFGFDGAHDSCITLRTCLLKDGKAYVQAGGGVVADSDPAYEHAEIVNKSLAIRKAIGLAEMIKES